MKKTEEKVINFIQRQELILPGDRILISLSGGADSVFLFSFLFKFKSKYNIELGAFHLNHQLRGEESDGDQQFCIELCRQYNVPLFNISKDIKSEAKRLKVSLEEAGRISRYSELERIAEENSFGKIATAHNSNDNSETVLLNLVKGTGLRGLSGIPSKRDNIIRPLLVLTKEEILDYLSTCKIEFRTDSSNESVEYERNLLRHQVLPVLRKINPSLDNSLLNSSRIFGQVDKYLSKLSVDSTSDESGNLKISLESLSALDENLQGNVLKNELERNFSVSLTFNDIEAILDLLNKQTGRRAVISEGLICYRERDHFFFERSSSKENMSVSFEPGESADLGDTVLCSEISREAVFSNDSENEFISADNISGSFEIRNWKPGDRFYPIGLKGSKKVSDFLNEIKTDFHEKNSQLVLLNNEKIVWVIGKRIDNRFKVTKNSKKIIRLWLSKK